MGKKNFVDSSSSSSEEDSLPPPSSRPTTGMKSTVDSGSDSDDFDLPLNSIVSNKQAEDGSKLKKPTSSTRTPLKRPTAATPGKDPKKSKTVGEEEGKKPVLFQRLWSDDDEVAILKGMLDYKEQKGSDPMEDANDFHDFIKSSVHVNVDRKQVVDKVKRLQKRFKNSKTRKTFNPHETIVIQLCNKIWGQKVETNTNTNTSKSPATPKTAVNAKMGAPANGSCPTEMKSEAGNSSEGENPVKFLGKASVAMGLDEAIVAAGLRLCSEDRKSEIEKKWRKLHVEESDLFIRKLDLAREESEMVMAALRSGQ